jgi:hypothetical protein
LYVPPQSQGATSTPSSATAIPKIQQAKGQAGSREYLNTSHKICTELSNVILRHVELMLDSYPNWCTIQAKVNHTITSALRVSCLNAKLSSNSAKEREEAKAGFRMGSDLFKRLALLPYPLTIRDWPVEEDVQLMMDIEEEFKEMMMTQEEERDALPLSSSISASDAVEVAGIMIAETHSDGTTDGVVSTNAAANTSTGTVTIISDALLKERQYSRTNQMRGFVARQHIFGLAEEEQYEFSFDKPSNLRR